ncbi:Putative AC transposase [Linum perenne]
MTTVVSESAFRTCGRLLSPHRSRLEENTIEVLMCSQNWLMNQTKGIMLFIKHLIYFVASLF